jgi:hypothetical protein
MFIQLLAIAFVIVTIPVWGGAMAALLAFSIQLLFHAPWLLLVIFAAPFVLRAFL